MVSVPLFRRALTAAAGSIAVATGVFVIMDANPSLYLFDKIAQGDRLERHYTGKRIWITGASSGIGAELAQQLARRGASLILSARSKERLEAVATKCRQCSNHENSIMVLPLDITCSQQELENKVDYVLEGGLDCVVFNAGRGHQSPALETDPSVSLEMMQLNALGPMAMAQTILKRSSWRDRRKGQFVVISSVAGKFAIPLSASYAASKRALHGYFESLGSEFPWLQIKMVCPGPVDTPFHGSHIAEKRQGSKRLQMPVERCARLVMSHMAMSGGGESWIAEQPTLFVCFLSQYFPRLATTLLKKVGPVRIAMWEQGLDLYDPKSLRKVVIPKAEKVNGCDTKQN